MKFYFIFYLFCTTCFSVFCQVTPQIKIKRTSQAILVDGVGDELAWQFSDVATNFQQNFPFDTSLALSQTEVRLLFDDKNIYVFAICYDTLPGDYVIQTLRRDFSYPVTDAFTVIFDPFNDQTNGFSFGVSPMGVQREGLIARGGGQGVSTDWDNRWFSEVKRYEDRWTAEMAIPFKTLRYKQNSTHWKINFTRNDLKRNESSTWARVPRNFNIASLVFCGELLWESPPPKPGLNLSLIPYLIGGYSESFSPTKPADFTKNIGLDAKISITPGLNLDLTINPDFSQVEVDRQVINLTRFSIFFPERRNFFLENSDLFAQFGFRQIRPFFSRQIGLFNG
ncbi:MAG: carbohydrate binding family 9 domain-containing protein, partial [Bacteroidia bacterium]|nr:carbohydrate binding family 9 domain-containing protein [Bacteroidia bacterium]